MYLSYFEFCKVFLYFLIKIVSLGFFIEHEFSIDKSVETKDKEEISSLCKFITKFYNTLILYNEIYIILYYIIYVINCIQYIYNVCPLCDIH